VIFVDTGAWIGLTVARDQTHAAAAAYAADVAKRRVPMLTTNYVLSESYTRIRYDDGHAKALAFDVLIREMMHRRQLAVAWVTPTLHELTMDMFRKYSDHEFSVVDCASFVIAKKKKIREVFGFDRDFLRMGFILRP
jgi:predicted nucleic acid-binding protein